MLQMVMVIKVKKMRTKPGNIKLEASKTKTKEIKNTKRL